MSEMGTCVAQRLFLEAIAHREEKTSAHLWFLLWCSFWNTGYNIGFSYRHYVQLTGGPGYSREKATALIQIYSTVTQDSRPTFNIVWNFCVL